jgi:hypothetical protein
MHLYRREVKRDEKHIHVWEDIEQRDRLETCGYESGNCRSHWKLEDSGKGGKEQILPKSLWRDYDRVNTLISTLILYLNWLAEGKRSHKICGNLLQ